MEVFQRQVRTSIVWALIFYSVGGFLGPLTVFAAPLKGYEASPVTVSGSGKLTFKPGETKEITASFQNSGTKTWSREGAGFISVYTYEPKYRASVFADASWFKKFQPTRLNEKKVAPKAVGSITFKMKAPEKEGAFNETFQLAAEDIAWIPGTKFTLSIVVAKEPPPEPVASSPDTSSPSSGLSALVLLRSAKQVTSLGGEAVSFTVGIKNTGTTPWARRELRTPDFTLASASLVDTRHVSWLSSNRLVANTVGLVEPGGLDFFTFTFNAPRTMGSYTVQYVLAVNETVVPDFVIDIPVEVTSNAPQIFDSPITEPVAEVPSGNIIEEPMLRVGILIVDEETSWQVVVSCRVPWELRDETTNLLGELEANQAVTAFYKNGKYWFNRGNGLESTSYPIRFIPKEANAVCTVENWDRRVTRDSDRAYNTYRNVLELRYNDKKQRTWLINEIPIELYLHGLGETSDVSHLDYQKALIVAARTYALYHWERGTKRGPEGFHITGYADDQVYRGYGQEERSPRIVQSGDETRGVTVTYEGRTALTPYFSRSDGRTRDWGEVWGGSVAWLKSVPTPCDVGRTLWGHGVGMSASEALCQANHGKNWKDIVSYFYQNISLMKRW